MGYYVTSAYSISPNDTHSFFVYFVPGSEPYRNFSTAWINDWMHSNFHEIAAALGPSGVIVAPPPRKNWKKFRLEWPFMESAQGEDGFLHGHMPFLLISRSPIKSSKKIADGLAMNLVQCKDEAELANIVDVVVEGIRSDDWQSIVSNFPKQHPAGEPDGYGGWLERLNKVIEIKPNLFGIGLNLNAAMKELANKNTGRVSRD